MMITSSVRIITQSNGPIGNNSVYVRLLADLMPNKGCDGTVIASAPELPTSTRTWNQANNACLLSAPKYLASAVEGTCDEKLPGRRSKPHGGYQRVVCRDGVKISLNAEVDDADLAEHMHVCA